MFGVYGILRACAVLWNDVTNATFGNIIWLALRDYLLRTLVTKADNAECAVKTLWVIFCSYIHIQM